MLVVAKDWGHLKGDVPKAEVLPLGTKEAITIDDYLLPEEAFEFVCAARNEMYRVMALVALRTGLRLGELRALRWREVDFERAQVNVIRAYSLNEITLPKGNRRRDVPLPSDALAALKGWKHLAGDRELVFAPRRRNLPRPQTVRGRVQRDVVLGGAAWLQAPAPHPAR